MCKYWPRHGSTGANASHNHLCDHIAELSTPHTPLLKSVLGSVNDGNNIHDGFNGKKCEPGVCVLCECVPECVLECEVECVCEQCWGCVREKARGGGESDEERGKKWGERGKLNLGVVGSDCVRKRGSERESFIEGDVNFFGIIIGEYNGDGVGEREELVVVDKLVFPLKEIRFGENPSLLP